MLASMVAFSAAVRDGFSVNAADEDLREMYLMMMMMRLMMIIMMMFI